jgi:hypothetical protein
MKPIIALLAALMALAACQSKPNRPAVPAASGQAGQVATLQRVNAAAYECWRGDAAFKKYGIVPELDTTGTPRILIIPRGKPQSLPQLVITATGRSTQTYGPLATSPLAPRINADVARWAAGGTGCA